MNQASDDRLDRQDPIRARTTSNFESWRSDEVASVSTLSGWILLDYAQFKIEHPQLLRRKRSVTGYQRCRCTGSQDQIAMYAGYNGDRRRPVFVLWDRSVGMVLDVQEDGTQILRNLKRMLASEDSIKICLRHPAGRKRRDRKRATVPQQQTVYAPSTRNIPRR
jgi:hypothetical protein